MTSNNLSGSIPTTIGDLTNLSELVVAANQISGTLPSEIGNLSNLIHLSLSYNELTGSIPATFGNLTNLESFYIRNNQLSGTIPTEIGSLSMLKGISLRFNQLTGPIPNEIGDLDSLGLLLLEGNHLSGPIPPSIGNNKNLLWLHLSKNNLTGAVPDEFVNLINLTDLQIDDNQLEDLPDLSSLDSLQIFRADTNRFTFEDIEPNIGINGFVYAPQDSVGESQLLVESPGSPVTLSVAVGGSNNLYQWHQDNSPVSGADSSSYVIDTFGISHIGIYTCEITNTVAPALTLYSRPVSLTLNDTENPIVGEPTHPAAQLSQDVQITCPVSDNSVLQTVVLRYRKGGDLQFSEIPMTGSGNEYTGTIPAASLSAKGLEYYIHAVDVVGNHTDSFHYMLQISIPENTLSTTLTGAATGSGENNAEFYRMISIPLNLISPGIDNVLSDDLGEYNKKEWRLFRWLNGAYREHPTIGDLDPGIAFWLILKDTKTIDFPAGNTVSAEDNLEITLSPGWNQIGLPFNFPITWQDIMEESGQPSVQGPWLFEGSYTIPTSLEPLKGYFIKNNNSADEYLYIPLHTRDAALDKPLVNDGWRAFIKARIKDTDDSWNIIGASPDAANNWDRMDVAEPPPIGKYLSLYFPHKEWEVNPDNYAIDIRSVSDQGYLWDLEIKTNLTIGDVLLDFTDLQKIFRDDLISTDYQIALIDPLLKTSQDLKENPYYKFPTGLQAIKKSLRLILGNEAFINENSLGITNAPLTFNLLQNYPNPFNPKTTIYYGLPTDSKVSINVFNILGKKVKTLIGDDLQRAGYHYLQWDGKNDAGEQVASGVYLYQLISGEGILTKKMILIR
jgi:Leucine-rich repeat (LRR) protein